MRKIYNSFIWSLKVISLSVMALFLTTHASGQTYTLTTSATNGSITLDPAGGSYTTGTVVTVSAAPSSGYLFLDWGGDLTGTVTTTTITMDADKSITANFGEAYGLNIGNGGSYTSTEDLLYVQSSASQNGSNSVDFAGTDDDKLYQSWGLGDQSHTITLAKNGIYEVTFMFQENFFGSTGKRIFDVTVEGNLVMDDVDIYALAGGKQIIYNSTHTINVYDTELNVTLTTSVDKAACCAIKVVRTGDIPVATYTLDITSPNGSVELNPIGGVYAEGTVVTLNSTANLGYVFSNWSGDATGTDNPTSITMNANKSVTANYTTVPTYTLNVSASNCTITLDPAGGTYNEGTVVSVSVEPKLLYAFTGWSGDLSGTDNPASITMNGTKTITANTERIASAGINFQGNNYTSGDGILFLANDVGSQSFTSTAISGTEDDALYQTARYGTAFSYSIPVDNGDYRITLMFSEITSNNSGDRLFSGTVEGATVFTDLDIFAQVGKFAAYDIIHETSVVDGALDLAFTNSLNFARICALKITSISNWTGAADNDWANSANWNGAVSPIERSIVKVPSGSSNFPTVGSASSIGSIVLEPDATLVGVQNLTVTDSAVVQRSLTVGSWQYLTAPVSSATAKVLTGTGNAYLIAYDNTVAGSGSTIDNGWKYLSQLNDAISPGKGYGVYVDQAKTISFNGSLITSNQSISEITVGDGGANPWVFIGNPFTAHLDWTAIAGDADVVGGVSYFYDPDFTSGNKYGSINQDGLTLNEVGSKYIPPMQGFFVSASGSGDGQLTLPISALSHQAQTFYKSELMLRNFVRMAVGSNNYSDEAVVYFKDKGENSFNKSNDGLKFDMGDTSQPLLYTLADNKKLSYNILGEWPVSVPLAVFSPDDRRLILRFGEVENLDDNLSVYVEDKLTGNTYDISEQNELEFDAVTGETSDRFVLHFANSTSSLSNDIGKMHAAVYFRGQDLLVKRQDNDNAQIDVFNIRGQIVLSQVVEGSSIVIENNLPEGAYLIRLLSNKGIYTQKVIKN